jgi:hypothetical protein
MSIKFPRRYFESLHGYLSSFLVRNKVLRSVIASQGKRAAVTRYHSDCEATVWSTCWHTHTGQYSTVLHSMGSTAWCSAAQHSTVQHRTVQCSTVQHSTAQHSTAQHRTAQLGTAQQRMVKHSTVQYTHTTSCRSPTSRPLNNTRAIWGSGLMMWLDTVTINQW